MTLEAALVQNRRYVFGKSWCVDAGRIGRHGAAGSNDEDRSCVREFHSRSPETTGLSGLGYILRVALFDALCWGCFAGRRGLRPRGQAERIGLHFAGVSLPKWRGVARRAAALHDAGRTRKGFSGGGAKCRADPAWNRGIRVGVPVE